MGGDLLTTTMSNDENSSLEHDGCRLYTQISPWIQTSIRVNSTMKTEGGVVNKENGCVSEEFDQMGSRVSSAALDREITQMRRHRVYTEILTSYDDLRIRSENLVKARSKILSYTPGAWIENVGGIRLNDYDVPRTTTLLLVGPRGSGKSSLLNRISKVFEEDHFVSERAQVSYNSSVGDGTLFLHQYMIPRDSISFSLFDTRSLCDDSSDNEEMLKKWMTNGVRHGAFVTRKSDHPSSIARMRCKARQISFPSAEIRMINFVIFVVNGLSVLKSMDSDDNLERLYTRTIATAFNNPYLSFKDDKPVVVLTHGDLLSLSDRARVRIHLGEILGIPPARQIFDIPENSDPVTELTILDMLHYSLEHSDKNLPIKGRKPDRGLVKSIPALMLMIIIIITCVTIFSSYVCHFYIHHQTRQAKHREVPKEAEILWHKIRHLWLDE